MSKPLDYVCASPDDVITVPPRTLVITTAFEIGDIVYLRVRDEPTRGMITGIDIRPSGLLYRVTWGSNGEAYHYDIELSSEREL